MATYVTMLKFTPEGAAKIAETCKRAADFKAGSKKLGVKIRDVFWTLGNHDGVIIYEAPDDETATAAMLTLSARGSVHTETLRAFTAGEMEKVLARMQK